MNSDLLFRLLLALAVVMVVARLVGGLFSRLGQPAVVGELVAGILLGPSLVGRLAPVAFGYVLTPAVVDAFGLIAQIGVVFFMFLVGVDLDIQLLRSRTRPAVLISQASILIPFLMGCAMAPVLLARFGVPGGSTLVFALFLGVSMAVTAFPVLARLVTDRGLHRTPLGVLALTAAAVDDVTAWMLLAFVTALARAHLQRVVATIALTAAFIAAMLLLVRPVLAWILRRAPLSDRAALFSALLLMLVAATSAEWIGIHAIFGAFLAGVIVPRDTRLKQDLALRLEDVTVLFFLPPYFAFTGLRTEIGLLASPREWALCAAVIAVATAGKFGGAVIGARLSGIAWRPAAQLGVLMNTRGLMELVVLNVGLDLGIISRPLFAMMVIMAVTTTLATTPGLRALGGAVAEPTVASPG